MDRSMYGKVEPGTLNPYQCTLRTGTSPGSDIVYEKEELFDNLSIENWIMPGAYAGHFQNLIWIKPPWAQQIKESSQVFSIGKDKKSGTIRVDCKENYFISECLYKNAKKINNVGENLNDIRKIIEKYDSPYILDVDLDFFSTSNPFKKIYEKASLYERLKEIYKFVPPSSKSNDVISEVIEKREKQLNTLEKLCLHLKSKRELPEIEEDCKLYEMFKELRSVLLEHYEDKDIDWELIHDAGCTCDDSELPHHVSTMEELDIMFASFKDFLEILNRCPVVITMSRSTEDDYTPFENVEYIQDKVIQLLKERFNCKEPVLDYLDKNSEDEITSV
ncbi:hypothetical protein NQ314_001388 [Rhamnusium bicolor]|uniref:Uncharacterized protein n=1 Tax=Rhamnusium bicolor TaxID=1586634 RepID=A0AAV8ZUE6_9CUCU|nr:hypothetical protein NQ314_001388 [Rhamnusium bicolor]